MLLFMLYVSLSLTFFVSKIVFVKFFISMFMYLTKVVSSWSVFVKLSVEKTLFNFWEYMSIFLWNNDVSVPFQKGFQDPASTSMEGIYLFNSHLLFVIFGIVLLVSWLLNLIMSNFMEHVNSSSTNFNHSNLMEIVWTSVPALILLSLASPSFSLGRMMLSIGFKKLYFIYKKY